MPHGRSPARTCRRRDRRMPTSNPAGREPSQEVVCADQTQHHRRLGGGSADPCRLRQQQRRGQQRWWRRQHEPEARGPITYVQGKDNSSVVRPLIDEVERRPPEREGHVQGADRPGRPAARRPGAALPGAGRRTTTSCRSTSSGRRSSRPRAGCSRSRARSRIDTTACCRRPSTAATYNGTLYAAPEDHRRRPAVLPHATWCRPRRRRGTR